VLSFKGEAMPTLRSYGTKDPDLSQCRTGSVGALIPGANRSMYYCKIENADCKYAMPFGFDYICKHPNAHTFRPPEPEDSQPALTSFLAFALG
jgi:hypothetical protein